MYKYMHIQFLTPFDIDFKNDAANNNLHYTVLVLSS